MNPRFHMTLRDRLALSRTYQAKERTILAYIRTGLAFIGVGLFIYKFVDFGRALTAVAVAAFMLPGISAALYGTYKILVRRRERKEFERKHMMVEDDGE